jgi:hypothetical protein
LKAWYLLLLLLVIRLRRHLPLNPRTQTNRERKPHCVNLARQLYLETKLHNDGAGLVNSILLRLQRGYSSSTDKLMLDGWLHKYDELSILCFYSLLVWCRVWVSDISEPEKPKTLLSRQRDSAKLRLRRLRRQQKMPRETQRARRQELAQKMLMRIGLRLVLKIRTGLLLLPSP